MKLEDRLAALDADRGCRTPLEANTKRLTELETRLTELEIKYDQIVTDMGIYARAINAIRDAPVSQFRGEIAMVERGFAFLRRQVESWNERIERIDTWCFNHSGFHERNPLLTKSEIIEAIGARLAPSKPEPTLNATKLSYTIGDLILKDDPDWLRGKNDNHDNRTLDELGLSARVRNCLHNADCETVGDIKKLNAAELLRIKNFGRRSLEELIRVLGPIEEWHS